MKRNLLTLAAAGVIALGGFVMAQASVLRLQFLQAARWLASGFGRVRHAFRVRPTVKQRWPDPQLRCHLGRAAATGTP